MSRQQTLPRLTMYVDFHPRSHSVLTRYIQTQNFGLISRPYDSDSTFDRDHQKSQWERLAHQIESLNARSPKEVNYKLLFLGRHGEGYHNVAERRYGTAAWDVCVPPPPLIYSNLTTKQCYWSLLDGDEHGNWVDCRLTDIGVDQAKTAHKAWLRQIDAGIPFPQSYYVSPLNRCLTTAAVTFRGTKMPGTDPFRPLVKEVCSFPYYFAVF